MAKNTVSYPQTTHDTVPASIARTGTISIASGEVEVIGVGTAFLTELINGDWIYDLANDEIRRIRDVFSDTQLTIEVAFSNVIAALALRSVDQSRAKEISITVITAPVEIDGALAALGITKTFGSAAINNRNPQRDYPDPVDVDASGGNAEISIKY